MIKQQAVTESELRERHSRATSHNIAMGWPEQSFEKFLAMHYPSYLAGRVKKPRVETLQESSSVETASVETPDRKAKWRAKNKAKLAADAKARRAKSLTKPIGSVD